MKKSLLIVIIILIILVILFGIYNYHTKTILKNLQINCIKAGEIIQSPAGLGQMLGKCCSGLTEIGKFYDPVTKNCEVFFETFGGASICSDCGNRNCEEEWENKCNCPEDCE